MCFAILPINPAHALEDEDMLKKIPDKEQHYETSEYGAIYSKLKNMQQQQLMKHNFSDDELVEVLEERKNYHNYIYELKEKPRDDLVKMILMIHKSMPLKHLMVLMKKLYWLQHMYQLV